MRWVLCVPDSRSWMSGGTTLASRSGCRAASPALKLATTAAARSLSACAAIPCLRFYHLAACAGTLQPDRWCCGQQSDETLHGDAVGCCPLHTHGLKATRGPRAGPTPAPRQRTSAGSALFVPSSAACVSSQPAVSACRQLAARSDTCSGVCRRHNTERPSHAHRQHACPPPALDLGLACMPCRFLSLLLAMGLCDMLSPTRIA